MLSIITFVYNEKLDFLKNFLKKLKTQTSQDFEVIIITSFKLKTMSILDKYIDFFKNRIKLIFNSSRIGLQYAINLGVSNAEGEYLNIFNVKNSINSKFVEKYLKIKNNAQKADIIEFSFDIKKHPIHLKALTRYGNNKLLNVKDYPEVVAYFYPFMFNKFYKTAFFKKNLKKEESFISNSYYSIYYNYYLLLNAQNYFSVSQMLVTFFDDFSSNITFSFSSLLNEWKKLILHVEKKHDNFFIQELIYAEYIFVIFFLFVFYGLLKNKNSMNNLYKKFLDLNKKEFLHIFNKNKYMFFENKEVKFLKSITNNKSNLINLYKEFK